MPAPRLLVVEGNTAEARSRHIASRGRTASDGYAALLRQLLPAAVVDICYPADEGASLPDGGGLESYDGVAVTGSALNIYDGGPAIARQIELARAVYASGTPLFGSCWGLQVATVAAGGVVRRNPKGLEIGIGRRIRLTEAGRAHAMFGGKGDIFDAMTVHFDEVETVAPDMTVLAVNGHSAVQAAEIRSGRAVAWGVQYHPEYDFADMAALLRRYDMRLVAEGLANDIDDAARVAEDFERLAARPGDRPLAWRLDLGRDILEPALRVAEIANWLSRLVLPTRGLRGRGEVAGVIA